MTINKEMWQEWKDHPVTEAFYEACLSRVEEAKEILAESAGNDSINDSFMRGFIKAYREMLDFSVEDTE